MRSVARRRPAARSANVSVTVSLSASTVGFADDRRARPTSAIGVRHLQPDRVQGDRAPRGAPSVSVDGQLAFEPVAVQVEAQVGVVASWA